MSMLGWIAIGVVVLVLLAIAIGIACYPRDNSF